MRFSVVTASFRQLPWLKRCIRSIVDQGVEVEHIIQDAGTGPELEEWVKSHGAAQLRVEQDSGMYDALNRGFARATGEILSLLNSDEQYLPGTLRKVEALFAADPTLDMVVGDCLIISPENELLTFRRSTPLRRAMILTDHLYDYTCALFFRRRVWERTGPFSLEYRAVSDAEWVARALLTAPKMHLLRDYLSVFTLTGENLSQTAHGDVEAKRLRATAAPWMLRAAPLLRMVRGVEKLLRGAYHSGPIEYSIYASPDAKTRTLFRAERPSSRHPWA